MTDLAVTVPKWFWAEWIEEGDAAGEPESGTEWGFFMGRKLAPILPGERLYIVAHGLLRGYAPVTRVVPGAICRQGGAVACTIETPITGFRGWRKRWWTREAEREFPNWMTEGVPPGRQFDTVALVESRAHYRAFRREEAER